MELVDVQLSLPVIAAVGASAALISAASVYGMRKMILMGQFSYHNARLSTLGNPYVMREEVLPLVDLKDPGSLVKSLQGDLSLTENIGSFREADRSLMANFHRSLDTLQNASPKAVSPLISTFINFWEMEELKRLLRFVGKRKDPLYPVGYLDVDLERQFLSSDDLVQAVELLEGHRINKTILPLVKESDVGLDELDSVMDKFVLDRFFDMESLPHSCKKGVKALSHMLADKYNIQLLIRSKLNDWNREEILPHLFTRGGSIGIPLLEQMAESSTIREALSILNGTHLEPYFKEAVDKGPTSIEVALDQMMLDGAINLSHSFGMNIGPTIRFLISKEMELKNLRTLFQSVFARWEPDRTKSALVLQGVIG
jgi:vacuolar-type H+-ATPase subunit C/Vma6